MADGPTIAEFMLDLVRDPERLASFEKDPDRVLDDAGLTDPQKQAILSGDAERIQHAIEYEEGIGARPMIVFAIVFKPRPPSPPGH